MLAGQRPRVFTRNEFRELNGSTTADPGLRFILEDEMATAHGIFGTTNVSYSLVDDHFGCMRSMVGDENRQSPVCFVT